VSKVVSLAEAIRDHVPDGASVALGCALEPAIPFSAVHELIRQGKRDLALIGPISDIAFDMLIGAGCVASVTTAWAGNVSAGLAHCYRRAMEQGIPRRIRVFDHSNFTIAQALLAGALGAPYLPTRTLLGSDIPASNGTFKKASSPFDGSPLLLIPAITPDVTILACQRSDAEGNAHQWGPWGVSQEAALAARTVIVIAEEVVGRTGPSFQRSRSARWSRSPAPAIPRRSRAATRATTSSSTSTTGPRATSPASSAGSPSG